MKRFALAVLLASTAASHLAAQDTTRTARLTRGMITAVREPDGTALVFDTLLLTRLRPQVFSVHTMAVFPTADTTAADTVADTEIDLEELDCAHGMSRTWFASLLLGGKLLRHVDIGGAMQPVAEVRRPAFDALCRALAPFDRPAYDASRVVKPPALLNANAVGAALDREYPPDLLAANVTGSATLLMSIDEDGKVDTAAIRIQEATDPRFGAAAVRVAASMRFRPEVLRGMRVTTTVSMPVIFDLEPPAAPKPSTDTDRPSTQVLP